MKVTVYPADNSGCGHYRLIHPARVLQVAGHDINIIPHDSDRRMQVYANRPTHQLPHPDDPIVHIDNLPDADIIVLQRPLRRQHIHQIEYLQGYGYRIVVEIDDDFHALNPRNTVTTDMRGDTHPDNLTACCELADLVTVTTPALANRYGRHGRVAILRNCVPASYLTTERPPHDGLTVGWSGSIDTHPDDLQVCGGAIATVIRNTEATFAVVGTGIGVQAALGLDDPPQACRWVDIDIYPQGLAHFDAGIVPLAPTPFNEAKSALKGLEMAAVGTPFIASPTAEYRRLEKRGAGQTAAKHRDWRDHLHQLLTTPDWRFEQAETGRQVAATMTYEQHADQWWNAWTHALDRMAA